MGPGRDVYDPRIVARHQIRGAVKTLMRRPQRPGRDWKQVTAFYRATSEPSEASGQVRRPAAQQQRHIDAAAAGDVQEPPSRKLLDGQNFTLARVDRGARGDIPSRERRCRSGAGDRKRGVPIEAKRATAERPFEPGGVRRVSDQCVCRAQRKKIHCAARRNASGARVLAPEVLYSEVGRRLEDRDHRTRSKRTRSPAARRAGRSRTGSNMSLSVVPMMCQPPGVSSG